MSDGTMLDVVAPLVVPNRTKIVLLSLDGLAGLPHPDTGLSELETAHIPHLSALAGGAVCGLLRHVGPGITSGSGPGHLGLFGYDPLLFQVGRGVLEALGVDVSLRAGDLAARGNFCTVDADGLITDRRAGRLATDVCERLTGRLGSIRLPDAELFVQPLKDHRFVLVLRGEGLSEQLSETDPQALGKPPLPLRALAPAAARTADLVHAFVVEARRLLADEPVANMVLLRGFGCLPPLPRFPEVFQLRAAGIVRFALRGLVRLVGMTPLMTGASLAERVQTLREHWDAYDFFFVHYADPDKAGEDGDFDRKVRAIEQFDSFIPAIQALAPDVLVVTGDHSTPSILRAHGWHPVPVLVSSRYSGGDPVTAFTERACVAGSLGIMPAHHLMPIVMAHARRLAKFGA
jgi:2,3-bisphosphoglycerate-independent phosphoglycerate mutase